MCSLWCTVISQKYTLGEWNPKRRGWVYFRDISLENTPSSHVVSVPIFMYTWIDSAMPFFPNAWLYNRCLPSFVSHFSCIVLLLQCLWVYIREKSTFCNNFIKKRGLSFFREVMVAYEYCTLLSLCTRLKIWKSQVTLVWSLKGQYFYS